MSGFFTAPQVGWGPGAVEQLSGLGARRALVVVDPALARRDLHRRVVEELAKSDTVVELCTDVTVEPTLASTDPATERARRHRPDWIVAVGGGSTIDTAKAAWIRYARPEISLDSVTPLVDLALRSSARFVAIPTTSGSGSEATWVAHLRDDAGRLLEVGTREVMPDWALLDASLALTVPPQLTAECGADLIAHALEAIASEWSNPFSDAQAREALLLALPALPKAVRAGDDLEAREALHYAATLSGLATANAQSGVAHALAHALGGVFHLPHARLVAALLPYAIEFNYPAAREKFLALAPVIGAAAVQNRSALTERLRAVWGTVGLPLTLERAGLPPGELEARRAEVVERTRASPALVANPRVPSPEELGRLLEVAEHGGAVGF